MCLDNYYATASVITSTLSVKSIQGLTLILLYSTEEQTDLSMVSFEHTTNITIHVVHKKLLELGIVLDWEQVALHRPSNDSCKWMNEIMLVYINIATTIAVIEKCPYRCSEFLKYIEEILFCVKTLFSEQAQLMMIIWPLSEQVPACTWLIYSNTFLRSRRGQKSIFT